METNHMKTILSILGFATCLLLAILTATGDVQKIIHFAGVTNEIAFCALCFLMATMLMMYTVLPDRPNGNPGLPEKNRF